jgi:hypothetical protein
MADSPFHKISEAISSVKRKLNDTNIDIVGTSFFYIRVTKGDSDVFGYSEDTYESGIINNAIIQYPLNEIEMFDSSENTDAETTYINLNEILPITLITKFEGSGIVGLEEGDILVDVIQDEHGNNVPIKLEVSRPMGYFEEKFLIGKKYELSLVRGEIDTVVEASITAYVNEV